MGRDKKDFDEGEWFGFGGSNPDSDSNSDLDGSFGDFEDETKADDSDSFDYWGGQDSTSSTTGKKGLIGRFKSWGRKTKIGVTVAGVVVIGTIGLTVFTVTGSSKELPKEQTSLYELSNLNADIKDANVENLNKYVETSYLAKEWQYFNEIEIRENFYKKVMNTVEFEFGDGNKGLETTVPVKLTHVDWVKVTNDMRDFDFELIQKMYKDDEIKKSNYEFNKELTNLFSQYIVELEEVPLTTTNVSLQMNYTESDDGVYSWNLVEDSEVDRILFSSDSFHRALDIFGGIATGDIGDLKTNPNWTSWQETYTQLEEQLETEKKRLQKFNNVVTNGNGTVLYKDENGDVIEVINLNGDLVDLNEDENDETSDKSESNKDETKSGRDLSDLNKNEDEANENEAESRQHRNEDYVIEAPVTEVSDLTIVNAIANQLDVMDANEPLHTYIEPKTKENPDWKKWDKLSKKEKKDKKEPDKRVEVPLKAGKLIPFTWVGAYYLQNEYEVDGQQEVVQPQLGNGTIERPLGFNTPVVAKMIGSDGKYYDVKVYLTKFKTGQDAIDYASEFDSRNRGFDISSDRDLVTVEFVVENLEDKELKLQSEFTLSDKDSNLVARTGDMYSFKEQATIKPNQKVAMHDWFYTKNPKESYLIWGKSFERDYPSQWYQQLALGVEDDISMPVASSNEEGETEVEVEKTDDKE